MFLILVFFFLNTNLRKLYSNLAKLIFKEFPFDLRIFRKFIVVFYILNVLFQLLWDSNELLIFQNPERSLFCFSLEKKIKIGKWSQKIAGIMSVSNINLSITGKEKIMQASLKEPWHMFLVESILLCLRIPFSPDICQIVCFFQSKYFSDRVFFWKLDFLHNSQV